MKRLDLLQPYPFERLRALFAGITPNPDLTPINLSIGEPKHPSPEVILKAMRDNLSGLSQYPGTQGLPELRESLSAWIQRRFGVDACPDQQILPVLGSREALFSLAQVVLDGSPADSLVAFPNPFYQIYEGATFLGGARPLYLNIDEHTGQPDFTQISESDLQKIRLLYVCTPGNPTGSVMEQSAWNHLFQLSDEYGFVIASDECYSEIYFDEANPPLGGLQAAANAGRLDFKNLIVFSSLSKRSNVPGLRSGYVAGDSKIISQFLKYRTYHGSAMSITVQKASVAAWGDETHVLDNRKQYWAKFEATKDILSQRFEIKTPQAGFYYWIKLAGCDQDFSRELLKRNNVTVLPGSFLGREHAGANPGKGYIRVALVAPLNECIEAANRLVAL